MISRLVYILFLTSQFITRTIQSEYSYNYTQLPNINESEPSTQPTIHETLLNPSLEITATESSNKKKEYVKTFVGGLRPRLLPRCGRLLA